LARHLDKLNGYFTCLPTYLTSLVVHKVIYWSSRQALVFSFKKRWKWGKL